MNLEESNKVYQKNKQKNAKKQTILGGIVLCVIIMVICFIGIFYLNAKEANRFKNLVDGKEVSVSEIFIEDDENGKQYINIKELAALIGYNYNQGDYIEYNEDKNSCYIENNYEIVAFKAEEKAFSKYMKNEGNVSNEENTTQTQTEVQTSTVSYVVKSEDGEKETFSIESPIKVINEQLYIPIDIVNLACNSSIKLTEKNLQIYSLDYLVRTMQQLAGNKGYETISSTYENLRAIANNMLVVGKNNLYGVISLETGETILSIKYDDIKYIQNENRFYVYVDSKVGILDAKGNTIISPKDYDSIEVFDEERKLFLVKKDGKYGLLNEKTEIVIHTDFDGIGITNPEDYNTDDLKNKNIWFDKIIAIKKGEKYALYDIDSGMNISDFIYDGFGYKTRTSDKSGEESVLIVPKETGIEGIVVMMKETNSNTEQYGIYDIRLKDHAIPCACSRIYSITTNGISTYFMEFNGAQLEMKKYFEDHNLVTVK